VFDSWQGQRRDLFSSSSILALGTNPASFLKDTGDEAAGVSHSLTSSSRVKNV
jgi:hypothetical protein